LRAIPVVALLLRRAVTSPAEHLHLARDDLGGVAILAVLVLPLASAQRSLDVDLRAFAQVLARDLAELVEQHDRVPLGALLLIASLAILPLLARREADVRDRFARWHGAGVGIGAEMADQNDLVDSAAHRNLPLLTFAFLTFLRLPRFLLTLPGPR